MVVAHYQPEDLGLKRLVIYGLEAVPTLLLAYPFLIWPVLYGVKVDGNLFNDLAVATAQNSGNDPLNRIYFPAILALTFGLLVLNGVRPSRAIFHRSLLALMAVLGFLFVSALWSGVSSITVKRALLQVFLNVPVLLALMVVPRMDRALTIMFWFLAALIVVNFFYVVTVPPGPLGHEGIYPQKNYLGQCATVAALFMLFQVLSGRGATRLLAVLFMLLSIFVVLVSQSKTSIGLMVVSPIAALLLMGMVLYLRIAAGIALVIGSVGLYIIYALGEAAGIWSFSTMAEFIFGDPTLTRRTDIWAFTSEIIARSPDLGYGYGAFWSTGNDSIPFRQAPGFIKKLSHAHNGYIDLVLQIGYLGFGIFSLYLFMTANVMGRLSRVSPVLSWFALSFLVYVIAQNFLETTWFFSFEGMSVITVLFATIAARGLHDPATLGSLRRA